ncbi:MAG: ribulokinase [Planctomycetaceae bacterium]
MAVVAGVDFGTQSVRVSVYDSERGRLGSGTASYPVHRRKDDPNYAAQSHGDHVTALTTAFGQAIAAAGIDGRDVDALGIDTTGSTIVPVGKGLVPLDDYYLWCDHRAWREAELLTAAARDSGLEALRWCGGSYSCEFALGKLWHWLRHHPDQRSDFVSAFEHCDLIVAHLCGMREPEQVPRGVCAMGHKWMWNESLGGLPGEDFFESLDPVLSGVRDQLTGRVAASDQVAGALCAEWAERLGLRDGIPIPVAGLDAHWDAVGAGVRLGDIVNVIGTSTCVMAITERAEPIPGVSGVVPGSVHPKHVGIEAGLSAAGDVFDAIARRAGTTLAELSREIAGHRSGQTGLLRLAWDNGDRTVLGNPHLGGVTLGWNLGHTAADELFAAIEGTAFQTRIILERMAEHEVPVDRVINAGGIPRRSPVLNQVYANALNVPILVPREETTGLGAAVFAFLAAGTFESLEEAQRALCPRYETIDPDPHAVPICEELFNNYRKLYFAFGQPGSEAIRLDQVLPTLRRLSE